MLALVQRVTAASVKIDQNIHNQISDGYLIFLGVGKDDTTHDADKLVDKIVNLRIMSDATGKMNKSIIETQGEILLVSQFTLYADVSTGRRPSFINAKEPAEAKKLYEYVAQKLESKNVSVKTGVFGAYMDVSIHNDGPVTIMIDSAVL